MPTGKHFLGDKFNPIPKPDNGMHEIFSDTQGSRFWNCCPLSPLLLLCVPTWSHLRINLHASDTSFRKGFIGSAFQSYADCLWKPHLTPLLSIIFPSQAHQRLYHLLNVGQALRYFPGPLPTISTTWNSFSALQILNGVYELPKLPVSSISCHLLWKALIRFSLSEELHFLCSHSSCTKISSQVLSPN